MKQVVYTKDQLTQMIREFVESRSNWEKNEYFCTDQDLAHEVLEEFMDYTLKQDKEKDKRYAEYLKLKSEFE